MGCRLRAPWLLVVIAAGIMWISLAGDAGASERLWCQKSGWIQVFGADGAAFKNQGDCISYVARGGQVFLGTTVFQDPGTAVFAGSGDSGYGAEYPASSQYVVSVGGTKLTVSATGARGFEEAVTCDVAFVPGKNRSSTCDVHFPSPGTYLVTATFPGESESDPGLLPSSLKTTITVLPCDSC